MTDEVLRYAAFTADPSGGNPAGVVLDATGWDATRMQAVAAAVGYSETAFLVPAGPGVFATRYFAPDMEVPFCGHATIASGVAYASRHGAGRLLLRTPSGEVPVDTAVDADGLVTATLTSVPPTVDEAPAPVVDVTLAALGWSASDLDPQLPPRVAYAGARHLVLVVRSRARLAALSYDFDALRAVMLAEDWITVQLAWPETPLVHHVRDPFPVGGVVEDPATGAAAAAYGAYLRSLGVVPVPSRVTLHQGYDLGRPSLLLVDLVADDPRVRVTGSAVPLPG